MKKAEPLQDYWDRWEKSKVGQLSKQQLNWARKMLENGCIGITIIALGRLPKYENCFKTFTLAQKEYDKMKKDKSCGKNCPIIYSVHFGEKKPGDIAEFDKNDELIKKITFNDIRLNPRNPSFVNFDFGLCNGNQIEHADMYDNPDLDGDEIGDYFPHKPIRNATHFTSSFSEWSAGAPAYYQYMDFNAEIWCVECADGKYGA